MSIEVAGQERFTSVQPFDYRRVDRRECDLHAVVAASHGEFGVRILNISAGGIGFTIDPMLGLKSGDRILMRQATLGEVRCVVRWGMHPLYGAEFEPAGRTPPGALALYDSLTTGHGAAG